MYVAGFLNHQQQVSFRDCSHSFIIFIHYSPGKVQLELLNFCVGDTFHPREKNNTWYIIISYVYNILYIYSIYVKNIYFMIQIRFSSSSHSLNKHSLNKTLQAEKCRAPTASSNGPKSSTSDHPVFRGASRSWWESPESMTKAMKASQATPWAPETSWVVEPPLWKNMSQIGFIFPNFRGEHEKIFESTNQWN